MPRTLNQSTIESLRRRTTTAMAYALGVGLVAALAAPAVLTPIPMAALLPKPPPVVARVPVVSPPIAPAPNFSEVRS
jgi:hypothetical protein